MRVLKTTHRVGPIALIAIFNFIPRRDSESRTDGGPIVFYLYPEGTAKAEQNVIQLCFTSALSPEETAKAIFLG